MSDIWDVENAVIPVELTMDVSRTAMLLYAYALCYSDAAGICNRLYLAAARAGLYREEALAAIKELEKFNYIETFVVPDTYGTSTACRLLRYSSPLRCERLSPDAWRKLKSAVFERDDYTCQYCFERGGELECDHVEPISKGGTNELGNLVTACAICNRSKRSRLLAEWNGAEGTA